MSGTRAVVVPSTLLLLPHYRGLEDPIPELREACGAAVSWLTGAGPDPVLLVAPARDDNIVRGVVEAAGLRVGRELLHEAGHPDADRLPWTESGTGPVAGRTLLVVANGTACRTEKAPGYLDPRAEPFDAELGRALVEGDGRSLSALDPAAGAELWCHDVPALQALGHTVPQADSAEVLYADDPFGVMYWVVRWTCDS